MTNQERIDTLLGIIRLRCKPDWEKWTTEIRPELEAELYAFVESLTKGAP